MSLKRLDGKETKQYTRLEYQRELTESSVLRSDRIGEIVIDIETMPAMPTLWVANVTGHLNPLSGGGTFGAFTGITANGVLVDGMTSPTIEFAPAEVEFCGTTRETVGIDLVPSTTAGGTATLEFRVTPTGVPVDNPFGANADFSSSGNTLQQDFDTLGDEIGTHWTWDLSRNPLAGLQCFDLGVL